MLRPAVTLVAVAIVLNSCADERLIASSHTFSADVSHLQQQEVVDNIDETIDDVYRIPRRTVFGKGSLTFADAGLLQVSAPLHLFATNAGSIGASAGSENNTFQLSIAPDTDGPALSGLRVIYQAVVYPQRDKEATDIVEGLIHAKLPIVFWGTVGAKHPDVAPEGAPIYFVGQGPHHSLWTTNPEAFAQFVLLTFGTTPDKDRVTDTSNPALIQALNPPATARSRSRPGRPKSRPAARERGPRTNTAVQRLPEFMIKTPVQNVLKLTPASPAGKIENFLVTPQPGQGASGGVVVPGGTN